MVRPTVIAIIFGYSDIPMGQEKGLVITLTVSEACISATL